MEFKINLNLVYNNDEIHSEFVNRAIKEVNDAYYASELEDLKKIKDEIFRIIDESRPFEKIKQLIFYEKVFNEIESKIEKYREASIIIKKTKEGSLEFLALGTGLAIWLIQQTIGQSIAEAWEKTNMHNRLVNLLTSKIFYKKKAEQISKFADKKLKRISNSEVTIEQKNNMDSNNPEILIEIKVCLKPEEEYPPSFGTALNNFRNITLK